MRELVSKLSSQAHSQLLPDAASNEQLTASAIDSANSSTNSSTMASPKVLPSELPEGYYLENFQFLLAFVGARYADLLTETEQAFIQSFTVLSDDAQKLYVRLSNRKGEYFRIDKIRYETISDLKLAIHDLEQSQLVRCAIPESIEVACALCTKTELIKLEAVQSLPRGTKRAELDLALISAGCNPIELLDFPVIKRLGDGQLEVLKLLFFGNFHQDMTEFVLHELVAPFESYELDHKSRLFTDRKILDELIVLHEFSESSHLVIEEDSDGSQCLELIDALPQRPSGNLAARRFDKIVNRVARQLERFDRLPEALTVYGLSEPAPNRERQARILEKLGRGIDAVALYEKIVDSPIDEDELEFGLKFGTKLAKRGIPWRYATQKIASPPKPETIYVQRTGERVEECALRYYSGKGFDAYYVENSLMRGLFGLAFWDVIFESVPGVFFHPFQRGPADLFTPDFMVNRVDSIASRQREISDGEKLREIVLHFLRAKRGISNQFVNWTYLDTELVDVALSNIPVTHLNSIFRRLLSDLKNNSSGLPDLILFDQTDYKMVEIKGPGDKLQKNQGRWFQYFAEQDIHAELINVEYR